MIEILHRHTGAVLYRSETATTVKEAVREANLRGANLGGANLGGANLERANLEGANLGNLSILQIGGSQHWIVALKTEESVEVRIGCHSHPLAHWLEHYKAIGKANDYTPEQIEEYGLHLGYVQSWAKVLEAVKP